MVDIRKKAEEMGVTILEEENPSGMRGTAFKVNGKWYITVNPNDTEERKNFTIAHELAEIILYDNDELTIDEKHKMANNMAAEFLMPEIDFKKVLFHNDLYELKKLYSNCSHEAIARRMLDFIPQVLTIFDNRAIYTRMASESINFPSSPAKSELEVAEKCYQTRNKHEKTEENLKITGYFIDEGRGVERVILLTEVLDM